jgi:hypothetical protein
MINNLNFEKDDFAVQDYIMLRDNQKIKLTFSNNESHNFSDSADFIM